MIRIGIVGVGFMGMIHYLAAQQAARSAGRRRSAAAIEKKLAGDWRDIRGNFGPRGEMMDLSGHARTYRRLRRDAGRPGHRPGRHLQSDASASGDGHRGAEGGQACACREGDRAGAERRRRHGRGGAAGGQAAHGRPCAAVLPGVRVCGRGDSRRRVRQAAGRAFQARHLPARLVGRHRRRQQDRRAGGRSAHSRHALHRPGLRRAAAASSPSGVVEGDAVDLPDHAATSTGPAGRRSPAPAVRSR